jgi:hypothetical protein
MIRANTAKTATNCIDSHIIFVITSIHISFETFIQEGLVKLSLLHQGNHAQITSGASSANTLEIYHTIKNKVVSIILLLNIKINY